MERNSGGDSAGSPVILPPLFPSRLLGGRRLAHGQLPLARPSTNYRLLAHCPPAAFPVRRHLGPGPPPRSATPPPRRKDGEELFLALNRERCLTAFRLFPNDRRARNSPSP